MSTENDRASTFIARLLSNPALKRFTPLQKEEQILQFLANNSSQLLPTLSSPAYFPGKSWPEVFTVLVTSLYSTIDTVLLPDIDRLAKERIDAGFLSFLGHEGLPADKAQDEAVALLKDMLQSNLARRSFTGAYSALVFNFADSYIDEVYRSRSYVHFELTKVQRLRMSKEEVKSYINTTLLLMPAIYATGAAERSPHSNSSASNVPKKFADKVFESVSGRLTHVPEPMLRSALDANVSFGENRFIEATSRIAAICAARCRNYLPGMRVDRGADTPDKSWMNIARRNFRFYGFDIKMVDEFYRIAAENGW
jgi:hypothetical protein